MNTINTIRELTDSSNPITLYSLPHSVSASRQQRPPSWTITAVALLLALTFMATAHCNVAESMPVETTSTTTKVYLSPTTGLIGCNDDKVSSTYSSFSGDSSSCPFFPSSLPTSSQSLPSAHSSDSSCTDNCFASLPSTGRHSPPQPLSSAPSRFSTNRLSLSAFNKHTCPLPNPQPINTAILFNSHNDSSNDSNNTIVPLSPTMSPVSSTSLSQVQPQIPPHPASTNPHSHHRIQQSAFPEPIIFQYVLYYPGNLPLVITAGHGGSSQPGEVVTRKKTHRFRRVADLATTTDPIEISSFAEPLFPPSQYDNLAVVANLNSSDETMPKMAPRDQTKGGNFKKDLNTHSIALNLANAISCLTSGGNSGDDASSGSSGAIVGTADGAFTGVGAIPNRLTTAARNDETKDDSIGTNPIPTRCEQQGPWGDEVSDYPFPTFAPTLGLQQQQQQPLHDITRRPDDNNNNPNGQKYPHVIVFRIPRSFVDVNRNITGENAIAEGDLHAEAAWREYHDLIDHVQKMALQKALASTNYQQKHEQDGNNVRQQSHLKRPQEPAPGRGLLLDIHGHAHATNLIEVGYLLDGVTLNKGDDWLNAYADRLTNETSVRALAKRVVGSLSSAPESDNIGPSNLSHQYRQGIPFSRFIRGGKNESLGGMLQAQGLNAVPSPDFKSPCQECIYFFGGYTIQRHGSRDQKVSDLTSINSNETIAMDAIQLELPKILRLVDKEQGREVGMKLGRAVVDFAAQYYGLFKEGSALLAREQSDAAIMAAMAKYSASRSGANTPRKNGGRLGGRVGHSSASQGGVAGQMLHSTRLHERLARVGHTYSRVLQQQQQQQHHHYHHHPPGTDSSSTSILSDLSHHPSEKCGSHSGDSNQSGDSEMESDRMEPDSVFSSRRPEIKRQTSRL